MQEWKGYGINETSEEHLREALQLLDKQFPIVYAYFVDEIGEDHFVAKISEALELAEKVVKEKQTWQF